MSEVNPYSSPDTDLKTDDFEEEYTPKMFAWRGRIGRLRFLAYSVGYYFIFAFFTGVLGAMVGGLASDNATGAAGASAVVMIVAGLVALVAFFSLARRRMHDLDYPSWLLILYFVPVINFFFGLVLMLVPGTKGVNSYGLRPTKNPGYMWVGVVFPIIMIGLLASIAIPAYQDYVERAANSARQ